MLTAQGFKRKSYEEFLAEMQEQARQEFGANVNLSDRSKLGKLIKLWAYARAEENETAEAVYNAGFIDTAEGVSLDREVAKMGIKRRQERKATAQLTITVDPGATVPAGFMAETADGIAFKTIAPVTDNGNNGVVLADAEAVEAGARGNVPANTITKITTPTAGVLSVTNAEPTTGGQDTEMDEQLRKRALKQGAKDGLPTGDGIRATILKDVPEVRAAIVVENEGDVPDADGRPPHSIEAIVLGGQPEDIAKAIMRAKAAGIRAYGSTVVVVQDASGNDQTIGFSYAEQVDIWVKVDIQTSSLYPVNGGALIQQKIVEYIGGQDASGNFHDGLGMGERVVHSHLVALAKLTAPGVVDATVSVSTNGVNYVEENVVIDRRKVAQTALGKVVVTLV